MQYIFRIALSMRSQMSHFTHPLEFQAEVGALAWKQRIALFRGIELQIEEGTLEVPHVVIELSWPALLRESNLNVMLQVVRCLTAYAKAYSLHGLRLQKEVVKRLLGLAKMQRREIDEGAIETICALFLKEKEGGELSQRFSSEPHHLPFGSINNPTFLLGISQASDDQHTETDEKMEDEPTSYLLQVLLQAMKSCRREVFDLILRVAYELAREKVLSSRDFAVLREEIKRVKEVLLHRRSSAVSQNAELEQRTELVLLQLSKL